MGDAGDRRSLAYKLQNIGVIYKAQGLHEPALEWFRKSLQGYEALQHKGGIARSLNNIGDAYRLQGRYELAQEHLLKGLRLREEGRDRGAVALSLNNLGRLYQEQGRYAEMLEVSRRAAGVSERLNDAEELWGAQERTGRALGAQGQPEEARRSFLASIATVEALRREAVGGEQQQQSFLENRLSPWLGMVELLVSRQEYAEALSFAEASKARVLLDALQAGRAGLRQALSQQERRAEEERRRGPGHHGGRDNDPAAGLRGRAA
jgi:tetratricopeptide (TPR) repeat protein